MNKGQKFWISHIWKMYKNFIFHLILMGFFCNKGFRFVTRLQVCNKGFRFVASASGWFSILVIVFELNLIAAKFIQDKSLLQLYHAVQWLYPFTTIYYFLSEVFQHISCTFYCFWDIRRTKRINAEFFYFYFKFNGLKFNIDDYMWKWIK